MWAATILDSRRWLLPVAAMAVTGCAVASAAAGAWLAAVLGVAGLLLGALEILRRSRALGAVRGRLARLSHGDPAGSTDDRLETLVAGAEARLTEVEERLLHRHRSTGLPTREPLLERMAADGSGVVGIVALRDFARMCAFDEALGERTFATMVDRARRMLGHDRLLAQVDRAQLAIWFGPDIAVDHAQAALDAVSYALGDQLHDVETGVTIAPDVRSASARLPADGADPETVLKRAIALLASERAATANPVAAARDRYEIEQDLRHAVARNEFEMLFQPLIDPGMGRVCGAEALLRWHHPQRGAISPARFIPLVEASGLADEVGLWVLNVACREARSWQAKVADRLYVAVNVSGRQLERDDMPAMVERTLARHALAADRLQIELTETVAADDVARAARLFDRLRATGVRIAIDDFGTGYSSLSALRRLAFDKIKIDREFVTHVDTHRDSQAICQSIIALGRGLGISVLAEGVERFEEYRWLLSHGCQRFQGYYFGKPMTSPAFAAFAADRSKLAGLLATDARGLHGTLQERFTA